MAMGKHNGESQGRLWVAADRLTEGPSHSFYRKLNEVLDGDGRTHLAHKAEHALDVDAGAVLGMTLQPADRGDTDSLEATLETAVGHLTALGDDPEAAQNHSSQSLAELVADKG